MPAHAQSGHKLLGGPNGLVKSSKGDLLEGMMVQLIAGKNAVRTTVYSDADGHYEFPKLEAGTYTLRIAQPREFRPFVQEKVEISGANALDDIVLTRITSGEFNVRSTAVSGVGLVLTIAAGLFLLIWWGRHFRRTRRDKRLIASDHPSMRESTPGQTGQPEASSATGSASATNGNGSGSPPGAISYAPADRD